MPRTKNPKLKVSIVGRKDDLRAVIIEIEGIHIPSTSNNRRIAINKRTKRPFVMKDVSHQKALALLTSHYLASLLDNNLMPALHMPGEVCILCLIGERPGKWDSHNYSKPIGDWLQDIGLIEDDSKAEILCFKRKDYSEEPGTFLLIQPREQTKRATKNLICDLLTGV